MVVHLRCIQITTNVPDCAWLLVILAFIKLHALIASESHPRKISKNPPSGIVVSDILANGIEPSNCEKNPEFCFCVCLFLQAFNNPIRAAICKSSFQKKGREERYHC